MSSLRIIKADKIGCDGDIRFCMMPTKVDEQFLYVKISPSMRSCASRQCRIYYQTKPKTHKLFQLLIPM